MDIKPVFLVKICGITNAEDARAAVDAGANALGFNFYAKSPRFITAQQAHAICAAVPGDYLRVGVFVEASPEALIAAGQAVPLDVIQLHGNSVIPDGSIMRIWRSIPGENNKIERDSRIEAYLLDNDTPQHGGSGKTFHWQRAKDFTERAIVAGGLDGSNVAAAVQLLQPWGVDACSRLESEPGRKDHIRMREFIAAALGCQTVSV